MKNQEQKHHWTFRHQLINRIVVLSEPLCIKQINITRLNTIETTQLVTLGKAICNLREEMFKAGLTEDVGFMRGEGWKEFDSVKE